MLEMGGISLRSAPSRALARAGRCLRDNRVLWIIVLLLVAQRLVFLAYNGVYHGLESDDLSYVISGINFAKSGVISIHSDAPTAQIMPGMPVFIGLLSFIFSTWYSLFLALKLVWIILGSLTAFVTAKIVTMFAPRWCGVVAACFFFLPNFVWMDNIILTETPYIFLFALAIWSAIKMQRDGKGFGVFAAAFFCAYMLRGNIIALPLFVGIYLLASGYNRRRLARQGAALALVLLVFTVPWSIRNYIQFNRFIPTTYGTGNAILLGTYQGVGYPSDDVLDYDTNVDAVLREQFAYYYDENGDPREIKYQRMLNLERDLIMAKYRMSQWWQASPKTMLYSYLYLKPKHMLASVFYWQPVLGIPKALLKALRIAELGVFLLSILSAAVLKKNRGIIFMLAAYYFVNIAIYSYSYSFDRYAELIIINRYIVVGIGIPLILELGKKAYRAAVNYKKA